MKILIICSKAFYKDIAPIKESLEKMGHIVELPNSYYEPDAEKKSWDLGEKEHSKFKARMFRMSEERTEPYNNNRRTGGGYSKIRIW